VESSNLMKEHRMFKCGVLVPCKGIQHAILFRGLEVKDQGHETLQSLGTKCAITDERIVVIFKHRGNIVSSIAGMSC